MRFDVDGTARSVRIRRIHMEEDAGKNVHDEALAGSRSFVDFNRGGTPLVEIVSEPDMRSGAEAAATMRTLRQILRYLDVCDGNMEEGSLRCDANVSVRQAGASALGTRTELKNINSFRFVREAIEYEVERQVSVLESGGVITQETRLWDTHQNKTRPMRSKEEAHDYRYFPEPDLPDLVLPPGFVDAMALPEFPAAKERRYVRDLALSDYDARVLCEEPAVARFFEAVLAAYDRPKAVANWVINDVLREVKASEGASTVRLTPDFARQLAELIALVDDSVISGNVARELLKGLAPGVSPRALVKERGLEQVSDASSLEPLVDELLAKHPDSVAKYKAGKTNMLGFFVGQVMKATGGKANPKLVSELVAKKLA